jgi:hypothetical protein
VGGVSVPIPPGATLHGTIIECGLNLVDLEAAGLSVDSSPDEIAEAIRSGDAPTEARSSGDCVPNVWTIKMGESYVSFNDAGLLGSQVMPDQSADLQATLDAVSSLGSQP